MTYDISLQQSCLFVIRVFSPESVSDIIFRADFQFTSVFLILLDAQIVSQRDDFIPFIALYNVALITLILRNI